MCERCIVRVDGGDREVLEGQSVAAALVATGIWSFRTDVKGAPRGPFCGMGVCFDCELTVDGVLGVRGCLVAVRHGMDIRTRSRAGL